MATGDTILYRHLDSAGDGSGTKNLAGTDQTGNYFFIAPPTVTAYAIHRLVCFITDPTAATVLPHAWGTSAALTTGIQIMHMKGTSSSTPTAQATILTDITDNLLIKKNSDWQKLDAADGPNAWSSGSGAASSISATIHFARSVDTGLILLGNNRESLAVLISDDLSDADECYFVAHGHSYPTGF